MDTPKTTAKQLPESESFAVSISALMNDPQARWRLLSEVRKREDGKSMLPVLYDITRRLAVVQAPAERAGLADEMSDLLTALGIEVEEEASTTTAVDSTTAQESPLSPVAVSQETNIDTVSAPKTDGFAGSRPTPTFDTPPVAAAPSPAPIEKPATVVPTLASVPAVPEGVAGPTLAEIKEGIARVKEEVGLQRFMLALQSTDPRDREYVDAANALNALGNPDTAPLTDVRMAYERLVAAAHALESVVEQAPQPTAAVPVHASPEVPTVPAEAVPVASVSPDASVPESVVLPDVLAVTENVAEETARWGANTDGAPATAPVSSAQESTPPPASGIPQAGTPVMADRYREPIPVAGELPSVPQSPVLSTVPPALAEEPPANTPEVIPTQVSPEAEAQAPEQVVAVATAPTAESAETTASLMHPEVTKGLGQLLSEWKIFEKSGFLGFGGHGVEHPLYKQLAPLSVAEVAAGRFEGVEPAIMESIQEYMAGWQKERGIEARPNETFETYLRRVIADILGIAVSSPIVGSAVEVSARMPQAA